MAAYAYDALGRRTTETDSGGSTDHLYYSPQWQVVEERQGGTAAANVAFQYVWGAGGVDQLVLRDAYSNGVASQRLYAQWDADGSVTALVDTSGQVVERYLYDPYGAVTVTDANGNTLAGSAYDWRYLFQGGRLDTATGWVDFRNRDYIPAEGRWAERDPLGLGAGDLDLYRFVGDNPVSSVDPTGLYDADGHFYTTYMVAIAAGYTQQQAYQLAYYSQYPDEVDDYDATYNVIHNGLGSILDGFLAGIGGGSDDAEFERLSKEYTWDKGINSYLGGRVHSDEFRTVDDGRYRANPPAGDHYSVNVYLTDGQPYLNASTESFAWNKGDAERRVDLVLQRGVTLHGRVTEEGTGRPVAGAVLSEFWQSDGGNLAGPRAARVVTGPDGSYQLAARPGPGMLLAMGPSDDYIYREFGSAQMISGKPGGMRRRAHAFLPCELGDQEDERQVDVVLRRGATAEVRVVGPDGKPARDVWMFGRTLMPPMPVPWRWWQFPYHRIVRDGRCRLHGLDPDAGVPVHFLDPANRLGATAIVSGKSAAVGPVIVRLAPCATARARLVDRDGKPVAGYVARRLISIVVTPGASRQHGWPPGLLNADAVAYAAMDPIIYDPIASGDDGRIELPALIPGASYCVSDDHQRGGRLFHRDLTPVAGQSIDLGEILIDGP